MAFQLSPGVNITEKDITLIVPAVATTPGGIISPFNWGPADEVNLIDNEKTLVSVFGAPKNNEYYAKFWYCASNFLAYGNNLKVIRAVKNTDVNAVSSGATAKQIKNLQDYTTTSPASRWSSGTKPTWIAKYPGELGNSLKVVILDSSTTNDSSADYDTYITQFDSEPSTSDYAKSLGLLDINDEIHILVIDVDGKWTGTPGAVIEKFAYLSKAVNGLDNSGISNYYKGVINNSSQYIWWGNAPTTVDSGTAWGNELTINSTTAFKKLTGGINVETLQGGANSSFSSTDDSDIAALYADFFGDPDEIDVSFFIAGPVGATAAKEIIETAETRKDCVAFVSATTVDATTSINNKRIAALQYREDLEISSSYGVMDSGNKLQYDRYNDVYRYVPLCADIAGCCVRTDNDRDPWFSPAGADRGRVLNTVRLAYNPPKSHRDDLYKKGINPVVSFEGAGPILYGDKTLLTRPSAFDRINVRRLFIVLEKAIAIAARNILFEFNDEFTRSQFKLLVEPYLSNIQARRGITDFKVVCNETNNTPQVIDSNNFVADIYIKPNRSINFVQLNFIATATGISFEEISGI
jgi:hypothetical protein